MKHIYNTQIPDEVKRLEEGVRVLYDHFKIKVSGDHTLILSNRKSTNFVSIEPTKYTKIEKIVSRSGAGRVEKITELNFKSGNVRIHILEWDYLIRI